MTGFFEGGAQSRYYAPAGAVLKADDIGLWFDGQRFLNEARQTLEQARQSAEALALEERSKGFDKGYNEGLSEAFGLIAKTKAAVDEYYATLEANLRSIVAEVVKEVIGGLNAAEVIGQSVRTALASRNLGANMTLYVSPSALEPVQRILAEGPAPTSANQTIALKADPDLSHSQCRLESDFGSIDLSVETQVSLLVESLQRQDAGSQR